MREKEKFIKRLIINNKTVLLKTTVIVKLNCIIPYLTLPHIFRLFFPINEGWTRSVNTSSFVLLFSNFHGQQRVQHLYLRTSCLS